MNERDFSERQIQEREYVAKLRNFSSNQLEELKNEVCIFLVSVGKPKFEGNFLTSQLKKIREIFGGCVILAADTLQRFNFLEDYNDLNNQKFIDAEKDSRKLGDFWIEKHQKIFEEYLGIDFFEIARWNDYILLNNFSSYESKVNEKLLKDEAFRNAMDESIEEYVNRGNRNRGKLAPLCEKFLIEECAVLMMLASQGFNYVVYPGSQTKILELTEKELISENFKGKLKWTALRLDKIKLKKNNELRELAMAL